jgi:hypothetical protein
MDTGFTVSPGAEPGERSPGSCSKQLSALTDVALDAHEEQKGTNRCSATSPRQGWWLGSLSS